ncbi:MAG TPA: hypothetical protein VEK78_01380 [Gemmatimonadales bacterium]|nr:hypothetical protein [Gemmatimonadales bacterium]HYT84692.1 hypothetical protein [Gemmatimonadales bacterium]
MKVFLRHLFLAALPLLFGLGASYGFALSMQSCGRLVGAVFASKCHGRQLEYQLLFQTGGTGLGTLFAAVLGARLEHRRRRAVQRPEPTGGHS